MADSDVIEFECPRCLATVRVPLGQAGKRVDCPECEGSLLVPAQSASPDLFDDIFEAKPLSPTVPPKPAPKKKKAPKQEVPDLEELDEDDLLSNIVTPGPASLTEKTQAAGKAPKKGETKGEDPFKVDPEAPIKIDGIGDMFSHEDVYGIKCNICDTRIHVRPEQAGTHVKCPECYSKVLVKPQSEIKKKKPKWHSDSRGQAGAETDDAELKLSEPIERPAIDESFGLAPVVDDMLAPKPKTLEDLPDTGGDENDLRLSPLPDESDSEDLPYAAMTGQDSPLLEIMEDELGLEPMSSDDASSNMPLQSTTPLPKSKPRKSKNPNSAKPRPTKSKSGSSNPSKPTPGSKAPGKKKKSRRELFEESQRRQAAAESATAFRPADSGDDVSEVSTKDRYPDFEFSTLIGSSLEMIRSPGVMWRVAIAIGLMCFGSIMGITIWPETKEAAEAIKELGAGEKIWLGVQWSLFCLIPYYFGLGVLWFTASYIFRDAALGHRQVKSWKSKGSNETIATFLIFAFGFFIAGLPAAFFQFGIMPLRMMFAPLLLLGAWYGKSAFSIVNLDAFKNFMSQTGHWISFYIFMAVMGLIGVFGGLMLEYRISYLAVNIILSIIGVPIVGMLTLVFAAVCGWNCGWVVADIEESS